MISLDGAYRPEFEEKIKTFCDNNSMTIDYLSDLGNVIRYNISMESNDAHKFTNYLDKLESDRKEFRSKKSFWWRLLN